MNRGQTKSRSGGFRLLLLKVLVILGFIIAIVALMGLEWRRSHPQPPKWPLASRECLSGTPLTDAQLIALALKNEQEFLAPYKVSKTYVVWEDKPDSDWWKGEYVEFYAQRDQRGTDLGLKRWAVVIIEYGSAYKNDLSSWYDACGNRFG